MFPSSNKIFLNLFANIWLLVCCNLPLTWEQGNYLTNEQHHDFPSQQSVEWQWPIFLYLLFSHVPSYHFIYNFSSVWICFVYTYYSAQMRRFRPENVKRGKFGITVLPTEQWRHAFLFSSETKHAFSCHSCNSFFRLMGDAYSVYTRKLIPSTFYYVFSNLWQFWLCNMDQSPLEFKTRLRKMCIAEIAVINPQCSN